jgi:hypothetical protein
MRFASSSAFVMILIAAVACGSGEVERDPDVLKGCEALCDAQIACGTQPPGDVPCVDACAADVGTPGAECRQALETWAACLRANCEDTCADEETARTDACGGTG